jgi:hypothetical protein
MLKHCAENRKRRLSGLPNVSPYIYDVKISGFTRSSVHIYIYIYIYIYMTLVGSGLIFTSSKCYWLEKLHVRMPWARLTMFLYHLVYKNRRRKNINRVQVDATEDNTKMSAANM